MIQEPTALQEEQYLDEAISFLIPNYLGEETIPYDEPDYSSATEED